MKIIKGVLEEELENSLRQEAAYKRSIEKMPAGSLVRKNIKGRDYYYMVLRQGGKVKFLYKGKLSREEAKKIRESVMLRRKYRLLLAQCRKQIAFLRKALHAKEIRSVS